MVLRVNGEERALPAGLSLAGLLQRLDRHPRTVAIEHNGEIVPRDRFAHTALRHGDRIEIVQFVQGG
ncbi:MAG: sulfur carrier protein ThiS [Acidobacteria bacterium]|nr:MAG: sulfur carrier protein ThiS [Acidobacteriota bacterium]REK00567.1 MAG: sulfur carrier protein ThiS [Acidobacteriota bacterium]